MATGESLMRHQETIELIDDYLPNLSSAKVDWDNASNPTEDYNCLGMAVGFHRWWSPPKAPTLVRNPRDYWPPFITDDSVSLAAFIEASETMGFKCCDGPEWEDEYEKIVLIHADGEFTHAAVQVSQSQWWSKFGNRSDIPHALEEISGCPEYGEGRQYMKRPRQ